MSSEPITRDFGKNQTQIQDLYTQVYDELRRLAAYYMKQERGNHTLQPTALVHEAYLRLIDQREISHYSKTEFVSLAANMMRRILVNHAVSRNRQKREGLATRITIDRIENLAMEPILDLLVLEESLKNLAAYDDRQERIFELRFFGGLSVEETAEVMNLSPATVKREWSFAKAWLQREMRKNY